MQVNQWRLDANAAGRMDEACLTTPSDDQVDKIDIVPARKVFNQEGQGDIQGIPPALLAISSCKASKI